MSPYRRMAWCLRGPTVCRAGLHFLRNRTAASMISAEKVSRGVSSVCLSYPHHPSKKAGDLPRWPPKPASASGIPRLKGIPRLHLAGFCSRGCGHEVTYEEMVELVRDRRNLLVDVREPSEREYFGHIISDASINIPLGELYRAFSLPKEEFEARYNLEKPEKDSPNVILYCGSGVRSAVALDIVRSTGYTKARDYAGGWNDWAEKGKRAA